MRDERIDLLRFCGLAMIILAHVGPPEIVFQLRNFDVPLMVLVSGMSFALSYKVGEPFLKYVWKRIKRLVFPVWIFLSFYFISLNFIEPSSEYLNLKTIFTSYALISGIGYVWIIRVFILVAIVSPFIYKYHLSEKSNAKYLLSLSVLMISFEVVRYFSMPFMENSLAKSIISCTHYILPYSIIFALGIRLPNLNVKATNLLTILFLTVFLSVSSLLYMKEGAFVPTQQFKYPPSIYYLSYAMLISFLLWRLSDQILDFFSMIKLNKTVMFIAQNSIWVYLWHIPLARHLELSFIPKYLITLSLASFFAYIQISIVNDFILNKVNNSVFKKNMKMMLTG